MRRKHLNRLVCTAMVLTACGKGKVGDTVRPDAPTASEALGESGATFDCTEVAPAAQPLVVDWPDTDRMDLALALQAQGVAVVHYGCDGMKLLNQCSIAGDYQFAGAPMIIDVVELASADSIAASLPVQGMKFAAEVSGDSKIDVATAIVGRVNTLLRAPAKTELQGECEGATHYVRAAYVGAFSVATGTKGQVGAATEIFGAGAAASSSSARSTLSRDGDLEACKGYDPDQPKPPGQCRSAVRVDLSPIAEGIPTAAAAEKEEEGLPTVCPTGYVFASGKCMQPDASTAYRCERDDPDDCALQCERGNADSCYLAALGSSKTPPIAPNSPRYKAERARRAPLLTKACDGGVPIACHSLGLDYKSKSSGMYEPAKARTYLERACIEQMFGTACIFLARMSENGEGAKKNPARARSMMTRACDLGSASGCAKLAQWYIEGNKKAGIRRDADVGVEVLDRACTQGKLGYSCIDLSEYYTTGKFMKKDATKATRYLDKGCTLEPKSHHCK